MVELYLTVAYAIRRLDNEFGHETTAADMERPGTHTPY
jgi:hypothetical protein